MSDETDREIARLRDALRNAEHKNQKLTEINASFSDTIAYLVTKEREQLVRLARLAKIAQGICPECGGLDLHSALLDTQEAVSCGDCEWIESYAGWTR